MKTVLITVLLLFAAAMGWRHRGAVDTWLAPPAERPKAIVFDNGTVREAAPAASRALASATRNGGLRKCVRGSQTSYTNFDCPPGFKERAVTDDRITVLEGQALPRKTQGAASAAPQGAQKRLKEVLDLNSDPRLRERMMDRAIDAGSH